MKQINWNSKQVEVKKIKFTPKNYKIKTDLGKERLKQSLKLFGLAGNVVVNTDLTLIDGNSRVEEAIEAGTKKIWVSMPDRKLTPKEFTEMSAMIDFAKAGEIDIEAIENDLGTREEFFKKWSMQVPMRLLDQMGKGAKNKLNDTEAINKQNEKLLNEEMAKGPVKIELLFTDVKQEEQFRKLEDVLADRFKTVSTTDTVMKVFKEMIKKKGR